MTNFYLVIDCDDGTRPIRRTTDVAVPTVKAHLPRNTEATAARKATSR